MYLVHDNVFIIVPALPAHVCGYMLDNLLSVQRKLKKAIWLAHFRSLITILSPELPPCQSGNRFEPSFVIRDLHKLILVAVHATFDARSATGAFSVPEALDHEDDQLLVRRIAGVVLHVGAEGHLLPILAVGADLMNVALHRLAQQTFAVLRPVGRATRFLGFELCECSLARQRSGTKMMPMSLQV